MEQNIKKENIEKVIYERLRCEVRLNKKGQEGTLFFHTLYYNIIR